LFFLLFLLLLLFLAGGGNTATDLLDWVQERATAERVACLGRRREDMLLYEYEYIYIYIYSRYNTIQYKAKDIIICKI